MSGSRVAPSRLLLVDDLEAFGRALERRLRAAGWSTTVVSTAADALVALNVASFDAVLVDYHLPDRPGTAVIQRAAQLRVRAVVMCAGMTLVEQEEASAAGAVTILQKPFDVEALLMHLAGSA